MLLHSSCANVLYDDDESPLVALVPDTDLCASSPCAGNQSLVECTPHPGHYTCTCLEQEGAYSTSDGCQAPVLVDPDSPTCPSHPQVR